MWGASIKKNPQTNAGEEGNPPTLLMRMQTDAATMENSMAVL